MELFLRIYQHLLPKARAWSITIDKFLRQYFEGLTGIGVDTKKFFDDIWQDIFPETTRQIDEWEKEFGLPAIPGASEQERRDRLDATWKATGGQDPRYLQDTLQANGFPVFIHEWWEPGSNPPIVRNPLIYLRPFSNEIFYLNECGELLAQCGELLAQCGETQGDPVGYPLVNIIKESTPELAILCGEVIAECGELLAECGQFFGYTFSDKEYIVPGDPDKWPFFLYIGGETFPSTAGIPFSRKAEFEALCLKICPLHLWLGILVFYT